MLNWLFVFKMRWIVILVVSMISNKTVLAAKKSGHPHSTKRQQNQHSNISKLLDRLLENYVNVKFDVFLWFWIFIRVIYYIKQDNSLRPDFGHEPAVVEIDLMVRSMGPVSEIEMVSVTMLMWKFFNIDMLKSFQNSFFIFFFMGHKLIAFPHVCNEILHFFPKRSISIKNSHVRDKNFLFCV
jgi:hypothetical protein